MLTETTMAGTVVIRRLADFRPRKGVVILGVNDSIIDCLIL